MRYPEEWIERVKEATDIVALIGETVVLKKSGSSWKGLCPFHTEKTPSFVVSPTRRSWHCFGCGKGGDAVSFLMEASALSFPEALETLAQRAGVPLPRMEPADLHKEERRMLLEVLEQAAVFYEKVLVSDEGKKARDYLKQRGLEEEDFRRYRLGFAPNDWETWKREALRRGFSEDLLEKAGLLARHTEKKKTYDKFRNRVMFPISDVHGKIIGFGGRILSEGPGPKYLNSPETLVFKKSELLYLLAEAKEAIRREDRVLVVEGYFDALALHRRGFPFSVATLGTALGPAHARLLKRYTRNVFLVFDADAAGEAAVKRAAKPLLEEGLTLRVMELPRGFKDPDEFLAKQPKEAFAERLQQAQDFFRWLGRRTAAGAGQDRVEDRLRGVQSVLEWVALVKDELEIQTACAVIAEEWRLPQADVLSRVQAKRSGAKKAAVLIEEAVQKKDAAREAEGEFLALLCRDKGKYLDWAKETVRAEWFLQEDLKRLYEQAFEKNFALESWEKNPLLLPWFLKMEQEPERYLRAEALLIERAEFFRRRFWRHRLRELEENVRRFEKEGRLEKAVEAAQEMSRLKTQIMKENGWS